MDALSLPKPPQHLAILGGVGESGSSLPPGRRELLEQVIVAELRRAWDSAVAAGATPQSLARIVEERRRAIESAAGLADDVEHGGDDPVEDRRVGD
jgi:hypothetical protein